MARKAAAYPGIGDWVALAIAAAVALFFLFSGTDVRARSARALKGSALKPFHLVLSYAATPLDSEEEIIRLRKELAGCRLEEALHADAMTENDRLRGLLDFEARAERTLLPLQVVGRAMDRFGEVLTVSGGRRDSLQVGQTVLGTAGLVGVVTEIDERESWVKTLRHGALPVSGRLEQARYVGMLRWVPDRRLLHLEGIPIQCDVTLGERVVTSGHGRIFPKGIPIGTVTAIADDPVGLVKEIMVAPYVNLDVAEEVFLLVEGKE